MILVVMGVCGSGKTTVGQNLAERLKWSFADADDFHSQENRQKMSQGLALTDEDRRPWLLSINSYIVRQKEERRNGVITCSALKRSYRNLLRFGAKDGGESHNSLGNDLNQKDNAPDALTSAISTDTPSIERELNRGTSDSRNSGLEIMFVHLTGSKEVLEKRMESRLGHFMPASLLQSQLETLEGLGDDEPCVEVDIGGSVDDIVNDIVNRLGLRVPDKHA